MKTDKVETFLYELDRELSSIPKENKDNYINEFKDHLYSLISEKENNGASKEEAINSSLSEFPNPKTLAQEYLNSHSKLTRDPLESMDFKFRYSSALIVMGIGELTFLMMDQSLNLYLGLIGIAMIVLGNILVAKHRNWSVDNIRYLMWIMVANWICLPAALFFFFRRNDINNSLIIYISLLIMLILAQNFHLFRQYKQKNRSF